MGIPDSLPIGWVVRFRCCRFEPPSLIYVFAFLFVHAFSAFSLLDIGWKPPCSTPSACQGVGGLSKRRRLRRPNPDSFRRFRPVAAVSTRFGGFPLFPWFPWFRPVSA